MKITQTKILRLVYDDGIGIRDVNSTLDNRSGKQHIIVIIYKVEDNLLQIGRLHLPVSDSDAAIRNMPLYHSFQLRQIRYTVVYKKHLPVAAHFEVNSIGYDLFIKSMQFRLYGITVGRRGRYHAQITCSHQRKLERTRDRRCRHSQRIYVHFQLA